jgi:hypothetical protein
LLTFDQPFTVVTQFHTDDGTSRGTLSNITRLYIQNNKIIQNAVIQVAGMGVNSIEESFCEVVASSFQQRGGLAQMGKALGRGMVLAMSIWNDPGQFMNWLDSGNAGPCNATEGNPALYFSLNELCVLYQLTFCFTVLRPMTRPRVLLSVISELEILGRPSVLVVAATSITLESCDEFSLAKLALLPFVLFFLSFFLVFHIVTKHLFFFSDLPHSDILPPVLCTTSCNM